MCVGVYKITKVRKKKYAELNKLNFLVILCGLKLVKCFKIKKKKLSVDPKSSGGNYFINIARET